MNEATSPPLKTIAPEADATTTAPAAERFDAKSWKASERLHLAYAGLPVLLMATVAAAIILALLLRSVANTVHLTAWLSAGIALALGRYVNLRRFRDQVLSGSDILRFERHFATGAALSGAFWGYAAAILFPPGELPLQLCIIFVLAGLTAGAMTSYAAVIRAFLWFVLPILLPLIVRLVLEGDEIHYAMAALTTLYFAVILRSALGINRMIENILRVRTENAGLTQALQHQATHDGLVDLINHREFNRRLNEVSRLAALRGEPYALLFIDLDYFKHVNDSAGHSAGDEMLRAIGRILKAHSRSEDAPARIGGDEFAVLLQRCPRERAEEVAQRILHAIEAFRLPGKDGAPLSVGASIGIAYTDAGEHDAAAVLRAADAACYTAKDRGRGRIEIYHADPVYGRSGRFRITDLQG